MKEWTFLTNHGLVLGYIANHKRITGREIAMALGITERRVQRIIADLEQSGYVMKTRSGRHNIYVVDSDMSLRHPTQHERAVKELLNMLKPTSPQVLKRKIAADSMPRLIPDTALGIHTEKPIDKLSPAVASKTRGENSFVVRSRLSR